MTFDNGTVSISSKIDKKTLIKAKIILAKVQGKDPSTISDYQVARNAIIYFADDPDITTVSRNKFITAKQAAAIFKNSVRTIQRWCNEDKIEYIKPGIEYLIKYESILALIEKPKIRLISQ